MTYGPNPSSLIRTLPSPSTRIIWSPLDPRSTLQRLHPGDLGALDVDRVDRAGETRIERMDGANELQRALRVGHRVADQRCLVGTRLIVLVTRPGVPGGRYHRLVVRDLAVADDDPVRECATRRLVEAKPALLPFRKDRLVENVRVPLGDVVDQQV